MSSRLLRNDNISASIPSYIREIQSLTQLRFEGNAFEGPIPTAFSNLTALTDLRRSKRMEASSGIPPKSSSASSEAGGEVRRIHIIYFLSHNLGRFEHPHLIRVHHFNRSGVYLRDVKRWLADLRGKDMPKAFAWSYKRRYKNGYVWQDLLDDDLITPISDNEFVLKGSGIFVPPPNPFVGSACGKKKAADLLMKIENDSRQVENTEVENKAQDHEQFPSPNQICDDTLPRKTTSSEISHESPIFSSETSTVTEDSTKEEENAREIDLECTRN